MINPYFDLFTALEGQNDEFKLQLRKKLIWAYSWAIPNVDAIHAIKQYSPLVETGAGTGYWAWLLSQTGATVYAFDKEPSQAPKWLSIEQADSQSIAAHQECTLFLCWPPYQDSMAYDAIRAFQGKNVIYIGEWHGRTADESFHNELEAAFELNAEISIPQWPGYHDKLYVLTRR